MCLLPVLNRLPYLTDIGIYNSYRRREFIALAVNMADVIGIFQIDPRKLRANIAKIVCSLSAHRVIDSADKLSRLVMGEARFV